MSEVIYGTGDELTPEELVAFYERQHHEVPADAEKIRVMLANSAVFVTARVDGELVGIARGVTDGLRGYLTECKLDPKLQGPGAVTRTDGRIEHDQNGIAAQLALRVLAGLSESGAERVDALAYGTEVDFLNDIGFKRAPGLVGMTMTGEELKRAVAAAAAGATASS